MQYVFDFLSEQQAKRKRKDRLFFALFPGLETALDSDRIGLDLQQKHGITAPLLPVARRHLSLQHIGDYPFLRSKHHFAASQAAKTVEARPFTVVLDRVMTFTGHPTVR